MNGLWSNDAARNAWVHLTGTGWRKLATTSDALHHAMLAELIAAKAAGRRVDALLDGNKIAEIYVI